MLTCARAINGCAGGGVGAAELVVEFDLGGGAGAGVLRRERGQGYFHDWAVFVGGGRSMDALVEAGGGFR